jgi:hypothetical protein
VRLAGLEVQQPGGSQIFFRMRLETFENIGAEDDIPRRIRNLRYWSNERDRARHGNGSGQPRCRPLACCLLTSPASMRRPVISPRAASFLRQYKATLLRPAPLPGSSLRDLSVPLPIVPASCPTIAWDEDPDWESCFARTMAVNVRLPIELGHASIAHMAAHGGGRLFPSCHDRAQPSLACSLARSPTILFGSAQKVVGGWAKPSHDTGDPAMTQGTRP